jgi:hypothetical protein
MTGLLNGAGAGRMSEGNDPVVLATAQRAHKVAQARNVATIAAGDVPMPKEDPRYTMRRAQRGTLWPPPPVPYEGYKPKPLTKKQQEWLAMGLPPPPSAADED